MSQRTNEKGGRGRKRERESIGATIQSRVSIYIYTYVCASKDSRRTATGESHIPHTATRYSVCIYMYARVYEATVVGAGSSSSSYMQDTRRNGAEDEEGGRMSERERERERELASALPPAAVAILATTKQ